MTSDEILYLINKAKHQFDAFGIQSVNVNKNMPMWSSVTDDDPYHVVFIDDLNLW